MAAAVRTLGLSSLALFWSGSCVRWQGSMVHFQNCLAVCCMLEQLKHAQGIIQARELYKGRCCCYIYIIRAQKVLVWSKSISLTLSWTRRISAEVLVATSDSWVDKELEQLLSTLSAHVQVLLFDQSQIPIGPTLIYSNFFSLCSLFKISVSFSTAP